MTQSERIALAAYYRTRGLRYEEIARVLRVDVSTVSRDIRHAENRGWLRRTFELTASNEVDALVKRVIRATDLEVELAATWGAERLGPGRGLASDGIVVVQAGSDAGSRATVQTRTLQMMAVEGARLLLDRLLAIHMPQPKRLIIMGVAWGRSTGSVAAMLKETSDLPVLAGLTTVPLQGGFGSAVSGPEGSFYPDILCHDISAAFKSTQPVISLSLPAFIPPGVAQEVGEQGLDAIWSFIGADPSFAEASKAYDALDLALIGIGGLEPDAWATSSGYLSESSLPKQLKSEGAVGDIVCRHFRSVVEPPIEGESPSELPVIHLSNRRAIGIQLTKLRDCVSQGARAIAVAGGHAGAKAAAVKAAVENGFVSDLVTDETTARKMLRMVANAN